MVPDLLNHLRAQIPQLLPDPTTSLSHSSCFPKATILTISLPSLSHQDFSSPGSPNPIILPNPVPQTCYLTASFPPPFPPYHISLLPNSPTNSLYHPVPPPGLPSPTFAHSPDFPITPSPCWFSLYREPYLSASLPFVSAMLLGGPTPQWELQLPSPDGTPQLPFPAHFFSKRVGQKEIPIYKDFTEILGLWKGFRKIKSIALICFISGFQKDLATG